MAHSKRGMVVAGHPQAAEAGRRILEQGGTAMDAAVTVSLTLAVAEPYGSGLGGKLMMLYFDAAEGRVLAVDAMDQASGSLDPEEFRRRPRSEHEEGWGAVAVPGLVAGMFEGHHRWGRLPWPTVVSPAAQLARRGFRVLPQSRVFFQRRLERIRVSPEAEEIFLPGGEVPAAGRVLTNGDLARTLETIAREGAPGFYQGWVAEAVATASRRGGGSLTQEDLAGYEARVVEPFAADFGDYRVVSAPAPASGGATLLAALVRLSDSPWEGDGVVEAGNLPVVGEALRWVYPRVQAEIADVETARRAFEGLLAEGLGPGGFGAVGAPSPPVLLGTPILTSQGRSEARSTTHFVVVDAEGNIASVTQSLSHHFGAGVVAPGTGVLFNNSMKNFNVADPASVNAPAPSKRPRSTIAPTLVLRGGAPVLALGLPGGQRIPTATLQVLLDVLVFEKDLAEAVASPRGHLRRPLGAMGPTNVFELESPDEGLSSALEEAGWKVVVNEDRETFGGFCAVELRADGTLFGVADLRRTNAARGLGTSDGSPETGTEEAPRRVLKGPSARVRGSDEAQPSIGF